MDVRHAIAAELPRLRRYARALMAGNAQGADDLVQQALVRALERLHLFHQGTDLRAWLFTILHNVNVNNRRALAVRPHEGWEEDVPEATFATEPEAPGRLSLCDLDRALAQLTQEQREIVLLVSLEGLSYKETSEVLGVPVGTVMSRLARGRDHLRNLMDNGGDAAAPTLRRVK